jgi:hypothetical protein
MGESGRADLSASRDFFVNQLRAILRECREEIAQEQREIDQLWRHRTMDPIELTISDGEEVYIVRVIHDGEDWRFGGIFQEIEGKRVETFYPMLNPRVLEQFVQASSPVPILQKMIELIVTELFGIRA